MYSQHTFISRSYVFWMYLNLLILAAAMWSRRHSQPWCGFRKLVGSALPSPTISYCPGHLFYPYLFSFFILFVVWCAWKWINLGGGNACSLASDQRIYFSSTIFHSMSSQTLPPPSLPFHITRHTPNTKYTLPNDKQKTHTSKYHTHKIHTFKFYMFTQVRPSFLSSSLFSHV